MSSVPERSEIETEYTWDLSGIYTDAAEWESAYESVQEQLTDLEAYEGRVTESPSTLLELLERREEVFRTLATVSTYANLRSAEDTRDQESQARKSKAESLSSRARSAVSFIEPELQELDEAELTSFYEREPALKQYEHFFDDVLRAKPHTRSSEVESVLADLGEIASSPSDIYGMLSNADMTFPTVDHPDSDEDAVEITLGNFTKLQKHPNRAFRQTVHEQFYDEWEDVRNTVGTALQNSVKKDVKYARARRYESARAASLDGPNVPLTVYDTLCETVRDNIEHLHRHAKLKQTALDLDELRPWDLYVSLTGDESPEIPYDRATTYITDAVAPLGSEYQQHVADGLESRWVDVYENRGKRSGAFSSGAYDTQPFILMNYQDDISSMFTLAHELGHSMHSELAKDAQPWRYADYTIFVAEVASTVNETLLTNHLLETLEDDTLRLHILDKYLERVRSTLYRQTMFAEFESTIHEIIEEGGALTPDRFDEIYLDLKETYYEPAVLDDRIAREWMRIPHFYYSFYVYQYATGISAAIAIVEQIEKHGEDAAADYRDALALGGSAYPIDILQTAGVDMTDAAPIKSALTGYADYLDQMETLVE